MAKEKEQTADSVPDIAQLMSLVNDLMAENAKLKLLAYHDALTGLPNRLLFQDRLKHAIAIAQRMGHQIALLYIDVDHFKRINDSFGHETGDRVLCEIARRISGTLRESDTLARMGGDEFLIILERVTCPDQVSEVACKIRKSLKAVLQARDQTIKISVSIGGSLFPLHASDADSLLSHADQALMRAKQSRDTYQFGAGF